MPVGLYLDQYGTIIMSIVYYQYTPYMANHSKGKTFAFIVDNGYLLENFHVSMLCRLILPINKAIIWGERFVVE